MNEKREIQISKFLSLVLRHQPEKIGLSLEQEGWMNVAELLAASAKNGLVFSLDELKTIVARSDKKRFAFNEQGDKIRASQGHSVPIEIQFEKRTPPQPFITEPPLKMSPRF